MKLKTYGETADAYKAAMDKIGIDRKDGAAVLRAVEAFADLDGTRKPIPEKRLPKLLAEIGWTRAKHEKQIREGLHTLALLCIDANGSFTPVPALED